ncbi:uncharacterized protein LODBEIA_P27590 [Lodderomyces beijingensis]|uniref:Uncharacterized protein n=1 Tax=Lodderomyces beijingensis TaxID=1775926 RepID=A0ABP0ZQQ4_9ASCO
MPAKPTTPSSSASSKSPSPGVQRPSLVKKLTALAQTQQFYWFLGHLFGILFSVLSLVTGVFYKNTSLKYFRFALLSIISTYFIIIRQVYFKNGLKEIIVPRLARDENVQYVVLALVLLTSTFVTGDQVAAGLYSYDIFAVFHVLNYFRNHLLEVLIPSLQAQQKISSQINAFTQRFNQPALYVASAIEVSLVVTSGFELIILPFAVLLRWRSISYAVAKLVVFLSVVVFNKLRYDGSQYTRAIVSELDKNQVNFVTRLNNPKVTQLYNNVKGQIVHILKSIQLPKDVKKTQ